MGETLRYDNDFDINVSQARSGYLCNLDYQEDTEREYLEANYYKGDPEWNRLNNIASRCVSHGKIKWSRRVKDKLFDIETELRLSAEELEYESSDPLGSRGLKAGDFL